MPYRRRGQILLRTLDATGWVLGLPAAVVTRYDGELSEIDFPGLTVAIVVAVALHWAIGWRTNLYRSSHRIGTAEEVQILALTVAATGLVLLALDIVVATLVPRSTPATGAVLALAIAGAARLVVRLRREARSRSAQASDLRVVVFGAGPSGESLVRSMVQEPESGHLPVALLDDDPGLRGSTLLGVPVLGGRDRIAEIVLDHEADLLVIAVREPEPALVAAAVAATRGTDVQVKMLPPLRDGLTSLTRMTELRDLDVNVLLGRAPVPADRVDVEHVVAGRRVLVTGAGGSIGSELCRQIHACGPVELMMLDRDESALHAVQLSLYGQALLDSPDVILADIRDSSTVNRIFAERRPEVVFHAAALKHLPMLEQYPAEAWKSNVIGTLNVLRSAEEIDVDVLVNVSTDKAANPTSVLGRSKRIGERLVADSAYRTGRTYLSVRFGNVLGSRGSVLTTFFEQLSTGSPLTVTDPEVSRYFMTIPEAVHLVLQAAGIGEPGEVLVLDMGDQIKIVDFAQHLMTYTGRTSPIVFTGLRDGEKLHEELFGADEQDRRPRHGLIAQVPVPALRAEHVRRVDPAGPVLPELTAMCLESMDSPEDLLSDTVRIPVGSLARTTGAAR